MCYANILAWPANKVNLLYPTLEYQNRQNSPINKAIINII